MPKSRVADTADRFDALEIRRYYAQGMVLRRGETFTLHLSDSPGVDPNADRDYSRDYELTFNLVIGGSIKASGRGLGLVEHWKADPKSPLLDEFAQLAAHTGEDFVHFELVGHAGRIDVVARDFSFAMVQVSRVYRNDGTASTTPSGRGA